MKEKRLIDANALMEEIDFEYDLNYGEILTDPVKFADMVDDAPTVDAVEVVRCKDCKNRGDAFCCPMCFEEETEYNDGDGYMSMDFIMHDRTEDQGFCHKWESKNEC